MKKILASILVLCLLVSMTACSFSYKTTTTTTTTTTDSAGNTTTTTTTETNDNGNTSTTTETTVTSAEEPAAEITTCAMAAEDGEIHGFPYSVTNGTEYTATALYTVPAGADAADYSNLLGENVLEPGITLNGNFGYNKENLVFDFIMVFDGFEPVTFSGLDFSNLNANIDCLELTVTYTDGTFHIGT